MLKVSKFLFIFSLCFTGCIYAEQAFFAMGCFWSAESAFQDEASHKPLGGINSLTVGYAGGTAKNPTYEDHTGYKETLKIDFDPKVISYKQLLDVFWHNVDPFDSNGQFCDHGSSYAPVIYYTNTKQQQAAQDYKIKLEESFKQKIPLPILAYTTFYPAEDYHQNYAIKNSVEYKLYRFGCGRDQRLKEIWIED